MSDVLLLGLVVATASAASMMTYLRLRGLSNPIFLISLSFFAPLAASLLRLSDLQSRRWDHETYVLLTETVVAWLVVPTLFLLSVPIAKRGASGQGIRMHRLQSRAFGWYARSLALVCVGAIITQNYLASGLPILFVDPELAYEYHTATVPVIQIFGRAGFGVCALLHVAYYQRRHLIDLLLLVVVFLSPLTRLARIDLLLSGMTLIVLNFHFPLVRLTRRTILGAAVVLAAFVYGLVELGNQRVNRFGAYSVSYAEAIGFRAPPGPGEVLAVTYGYFALSFENLDRFVRGNQRYRTWGLLSFSPLFNAFFIVDRLTGGAYPGPEVIVARRNPVGRMATVETALSAFYLDFGTGIAWLPMLLSMSLWLALYRRRERATGYAVAYSMYSAAMMLSAFQPVAAAPFLYQAIALAGLPFVLPKLRWPRQPSLAPAARS